MSAPVTDAIVAAVQEAAYADAARVPVLLDTLVDTVGCALGGLGASAAVRRWAVTEPSPGPCAVWGTDGTASASRAALLNGTAGHVLDLDDAVPSMPLHPSTVLWPAVLAVAEQETASWDDALAAVDLGNAVLRALTEALPSDAHYARGWHTTSTAGRVAAVAAIARLLRLDGTMTSRALGIVASTAAGSRASFGTTTKALHAGLAAHDAVLAVGLARAGVDAHPAQLDHPLGFLAMYGDPGPRDGFAASLQRWRADWTWAWTLKQHASCYGTHYAADASVALAHEVDPTGIESVRVRVHPGALRPLLAHEPTTGTEAKFHLPTVVASGLIDGALGEDAFTDDAVRRPELLDLRSRVVIEAVAAPADLPRVAGAPYAEVALQLSDGTARSRLVTITRGDARDPLGHDEVDRKAVGLAGTAGWSPQDADALVRHLREDAVGDGPVSLARLVRAPATAPTPRKDGAR